MINAPFDIAIKIGEGKESEIATLFWQNEFIVFPGCKNHRYDFGIYKNHIDLIEIKNEDNYSGSGYICIEIYQGKRERKPSGIEVSESTVFVHTLNNRVAFYKTQKMRLWLRKYRVKECKGVHKGIYTVQDFKNADNGNGGYIIPIKHIINCYWFCHCEKEKMPSHKMFSKMFS